MNISIRHLKQNDIATCIKLFHETVHTANAKDYHIDQLNVWAPEGITPNDDRWLSLLKNTSLIAEIDSNVVGFIDMTNSGYLDRLFVHKDFQRRGIARSLLLELERIAKKNGIIEITTEASITAKPFFTAHGYQVVIEQEKKVSGIVLINYLMKKKIVLV